MRGYGWFDTLRLDARYAWRTMRQAPAFTSIAMLSLAMGIGATTAVFTLVDALLLRPLPVRAPGELVQVLSRFPGEPRNGGFAWNVYEHFRDATQVFTDLVAVSPSRFDVGEAPGSRQTMEGEYVSGNFFPALGIKPAAGRLIDADDDVVGGSNAAVVVLSWSAWRTRYNSSPSALGARLVVNGAPLTIVGVAPRGFFGLQVGASRAVASMARSPSGLSAGRGPARRWPRSAPKWMSSTAGASRSSFGRGTRRSSAASRWRRHRRQRV
jgi:putative ABC transport system permease protein